MCLALDVPRSDVARWVRLASPHIGWFKIGLQLFCDAGPDIVARVRALGAQRVFLDLKLHDIPNTVASAVRVLDRAGVDLLTVHTGGGDAMMRAAALAATQTAVVGVTVLTSLDDDTLVPVGLRAPVSELAVLRAHAAMQAGLDGVVCSGHEVALVRQKLGPSARLVTPGIRFLHDDAGDQARIADPARTLADGSDLLVIGRMITSAPDPESALQQLKEAVTE